jgi:hypothetical protein
MAEQNDPAVADELVEVDGAIGGVRIKIWSCVAKAKGWSTFFCGTHVAVQDGFRILRKNGALTEVKSGKPRGMNDKIFARKLFKPK